MSFTKAQTVIHKLVYRIAGKKYKDFLSIAFAWKNIVGSLLAERASVFKYENSVLYIAVTNNVWMQELVLQRSIILKKLKKQTNIDIKDIVYFIKDS